ncbi:hypothetical protein R0137_06075 [Congregibacter brevis]|uniref:Secreted protein n=1 Tax=Congregibacter brevis TaxID=3081201 RepID=A0ABZ0IF10_9GAMM|nr:hypothetical protein R0137_06075 [Congregibacter sp. IMCC45268]
MRNSKLFTVVLAAALMLSNIACACVSSAVASESSNSSQTSDHHAASDNPAAGLQCAHQDCGGCDELQDSCATPDYTVVSAERDIRVATLTEINLDSGDLDLIYTGVDPPWYPRTFRVAPPLDSVVVVRPLDTPINRKDQLTE